MSDTENHVLMCVCGQVNDTGRHWPSEVEPFACRDCGRIIGGWARSGRQIDPRVAPANDPRRQPPDPRHGGPL